MSLSDSQFQSGSIIGSATQDHHHVSKAIQGSIEALAIQGSMMTRAIQGFIGQRAITFLLELPYRRKVSGKSTETSAENKSSSEIALF